MGLGIAGDERSPEERFHFTPGTRGDSHTFIVKTHEVDTRPESCDKFHSKPVLTRFEATGAAPGSPDDRLYSPHSGAHEKEFGGQNNFFGGKLQDGHLHGGPLI